jgi:heme-degrading monooxygenase HmoA
MLVCKFQPAWGSGERRRDGMFARMSTYEDPPDRTQEGISHARERILPAVRNIVCFSGVLFLADRETGKALSITLWESEQAMRDSEEEASRLRSESAKAGGETIAGVERYEVPIFEVSLSGGGEERGFMDRLTGR